MQNIRIIEIPACKMASSGVGMFGEEKFDRFCDWFSSQPRSIYPKDFLYWDDTNPDHPGMHWLFICDGGTMVPSEFDIIVFSGGLYAVATDIDQNTDMNAMRIAWVKDGTSPTAGRIRIGDTQRTPWTFLFSEYHTDIKAVNGDFHRHLKI